MAMEWWKPGIRPGAPKVNNCELLERVFYRPDALPVTN